MKISVRIFLAVAVMAMFAIHSCEKNENENETKISSYNSTESHKEGQNCMTCHKSGGSGEGWASRHSQKGGGFLPGDLCRTLGGPRGSDQALLGAQPGRDDHRQGHLLPLAVRASSSSLLWISARRLHSQRQQDHRILQAGAGDRGLGQTPSTAGAAHRPDRGRLDEGPGSQRGAGHHGSGTDVSLHARFKKTGHGHRHVGCQRRSEKRPLKKRSLWTDKGVCPGEFATGESEFPKVCACRKFFSSIL